MSAKWDIDLNSPYAHMPDFAHLRPEAQDAVRDTIRKRIVDHIYEQREAILEDAIPKALAKKCGLAFKAELVIDQPHPMWDAQSKPHLITLRFYLTDVPPAPRSDGWQFLPYESLKDLWDTHARRVEDHPKVG